MVQRNWSLLSYWWVKWKSLSYVQLFATPWPVQSMEFSRPEYGSGYPFPFPGDLPNPGIRPGSPALQADCTHWVVRELLEELIVTLMCWFILAFCHLSEKDVAFTRIKVDQWEKILDSKNYYSNVCCSFYY